MNTVRALIVLIVVTAVEIGILQRVFFSKMFYVDVLAVVAILFSLEFGWARAGFVTFAGGVLQDTFSGGPFGIGCLSLAAGSFFAGSVRIIVFSEHATTRLFMVFMSTIVIILSRVFLEILYSVNPVISPAGFILHTVLPTAALNTAAAFILYPLTKKFMFSGFAAKN